MFEDHLLSFLTSRVPTMTAFNWCHKQNYKWILSQLIGNDMLSVATYEKVVFSLCQILIIFNFDMVFESHRIRFWRSLMPGMTLLNDINWFYVTTNEKFKFYFTISTNLVVIFFLIVLRSQKTDNKNDIINTRNEISATQIVTYHGRWWSLLTFRWFLKVTEAYYCNVKPRKGFLANKISQKWHITLADILAFWPFVAKFDTWGHLGLMSL